MSVAWHTRNALGNGNGERVEYNTFGGEFNTDNLCRLVNGRFSVTVEGGSLVFVDRNQRLVQLYLRVDPMWTPEGGKVWHAYLEHQAEMRAARERELEPMRAELEELLEELGPEDALKRLKGEV